MICYIRRLVRLPVRTSSLVPARGNFGPTAPACSAKNKRCRTTKGDCATAPRVETPVSSLCQDAGRAETEVDLTSPPQQPYIAIAPPRSFVGKDAAEFVQTFERHARAAHDTGQRVFGNEHRQTGLLGEQSIEVA